MIAHRGIAQSALVIGFFILSVGLVTGTAEAKPPKRVTVDCTAGDTIADALTKSPGQPLVVNIEGVCNENVTITRNNVTLQGVNPTSSEIRGVAEADPFEESPITLLGAQLVVIDNLTGSGGQSSGIAGSSSFFTVSNSVIANNGRSGIAVIEGSTARIDSTMIRKNARHGITVRAAFAQITNNMILMNTRNGIGVFAGGNARIGEASGGTPGPNTIRMNNNGIAVIGPGRADILNNTIEDNANHGIDATDGAFAFIDNSIIRRNVKCGVIVRDGGNVRLRNNTVESAQGNPDICSTIGVFRNASARLVGGNTVTNTGGGFALDLSHGATFRQSLGHDTIVGKAAVFNMTNADFRDVDITGNVNVFSNSTLRLRDEGGNPSNISVTGDINISSHIAQFSASSPVTVSGNVNCFLPDGLAFGSPMFVGGGMLNCP